MSDDQVIDTSSGKYQREAKNERVLDEQEEERDLLHVAGSQPGRRLLWRLLSRGNIFSDPFAGSGMSEDTAYFLGRQSSARELYATFQTTPPLRAAFRRMQEDADKNGW